MLKYYLLLIIPILFLMSCGKGLSPEPEESVPQTGFGGTVYFKGNWPDSVQRTLIMALKKEIETEADFNILNFGFVSDFIPFDTKQIIYSSQVNPILPVTPGEYKYVVVVQSATPEVSFLRKDWRVVGVYYANGDTTKPGSITIIENAFLKDINITCDFDNPPPQPPGGP